MDSESKPLANKSNDDRSISRFGDIIPGVIDQIETGTLPNTVVNPEPRPVFHPDIQRYNEAREHLRYLIESKTGTEDDLGAARQELDSSLAALEDSSDTEIS